VGKFSWRTGDCPMKRAEGLDSGRKEGLKKNLGNTAKSIKIKGT